MTDKETHPSILEEYAALKEDKGMRPFLEEIGALFQNTNGREEEIGLLLELVKGRLGSGTYAKKKETLAKKLGLEKKILEDHLAGMRHVKMGRKFYSPKPRQIIEE